MWVPARYSSDIAVLEANPIVVVNRSWAATLVNVMQG
jgi:hypothetical protein